MERKELESIVADEVGRVYPKDEADQVMDAMEARIKELEETHNLEECPFRSENRELKNRIKELESQLGTELGTRLGTDHIVDVNKMMWVSVKERLPEEAKRVIVSDNLVRKDGVIIGQFVQEASCEEGIFVDPLGYPLQHVTHWMPLPMPPKEEK